MFNVLSNLVEGAAKVAVGAVVAPVALAVDVVRLPVTAESMKEGPFDNTASALNLVVDGVKTAVKND